MSAELTGITASALRERIARKEVKPSEATAAYLRRIEQWNGKLGAYITVDGEGATAAAKKLDERQGKGEDLGPLGGVPVAMKDIFTTRGLKTTCGSRVLESYVPPYDATVVRMLRDAGAVVLGKANMDEFAMGSSNENSAFGPARNPWDLARTPGGSSGGSAVAVAADLCAVATGTDTGGSIRQPASLSGVVGLKPTYGRVSRYGMIAFASSLDQGGPLAKSVADAATLLGVMAGHDPLDSTSSRVAVPDFAAAAVRGAKGDVKGMRIAIPREYFGKGLDPEVEQVVRATAAALEKQGARISEVSLPDTGFAVATYYLVATAEASSNLARYDGVRYGMRVEAPGLVEMYAKTRDEGFGQEVKRRILLGTYVLSAGYYEAYYKKAMQVRTVIRRAFESVLADHDAILGPVAPTPAFKLGEKVDDPLAMYLSDIYTISVNLSGLPGISVPAGFSGNKLPIGAQLIGRAFDEETLLRAGAAIEGAMGVANEKPGMTAAAAGGAA